MDEVKRLGIFATYSHDGIVDDYILYYLSEIRRCLKTLVVVSNIQLSYESKIKINDYADYIFERDDHGFDVGGLRSVMVEFLGWNKIKDYDELILMNDSVFGPFYPFEEVFQKMNQNRELDFWGLCKRGKSNFDGGEVLFFEHIQLYFLVVRKKMLCSKDFEIYWNDIDKKITNFRTAIFNYEFTFTKHFAEKGYKWDVYCHIKDYETDNPKLNLSPYHYASYKLIKNFRCPVLKRKLFTSEFVEMKYSSREDLIRTFNYIKEETEYDIDLIWKYILSNYPLYNIIDSLKLCYTLNSVSSLKEKKYQEDITLVKCSEDDSIFDDFFENIQCFSSNYKEWGSLILLVAKMNVEGEPHSIIESEEYRNYENLVKNKVYIAEIVKLFNDNPRLGVLVPPTPLYGNASDYILSTWKNNVRAKKVYNKLKLNVPFDEDRAPVPPITALLFRKDILDDLLMSFFTAGYANDLLQMIPLYAQAKNYYTAYVQSSDYVSINYFNNNRLLYDLLKASRANASQNVNSILDNLQCGSIREFCDDNKHIIIYGAGQLAERAAKIIEQVGRKFNCFVVTSLADNTEVLLDHKVCVIDNILELDGNVGFVIAVGTNHNRQVSEYLNSLGFKRQLIF